MNTIIRKFQCLPLIPFEAQKEKLLVHKIDERKNERDKLKNRQEKLKKIHKK